MILRVSVTKSKWLLRESVTKSNSVTKSKCYLESMILRVSVTK